ncbi:MAG: ribosome maturation factor RimM [Lachnospiraceae bacterium]|nr:ribosome maturation factor RimM [Lachnospiraceae bacterium]
MNRDELLQVGAITTTHGVKGEVKVFPTTDDPLRFKKLKTVILYNGKEFREVKVQSVKFFKQFVIVKLEGIDSMNDAETLRNAELLVERSDAVKCEEDEYFIADLIGLKVYDEQGLLLGSVSEVYQTGANDVYEITDEAGKTFLIPAIKECVLSVSIPDQRMTIHVMDGLLS